MTADELVALLALTTIACCAAWLVDRDPPREEPSTLWRERTRRLALTIVCPAWIVIGALIAWAAIGDIRTGFSGGLALCLGLMMIAGGVVEQVGFARWYGPRARRIRLYGIALMVAPTVVSWVLPFLLLVLAVVWRTALTQIEHEAPLPAPQPVG